MMNSFQKAKSFNMELSMDNTVKDDSKTTGKWTMVYDEGFDITLGKFTYFAFSKYQHTNNKYESICSETLIGWYNNLDTGDKGCMRA
jgi:cathepsin C